MSSVWADRDNIFTIFRRKSAPDVPAAPSPFTGAPNQIIEPSNPAQRQGGGMISNAVTQAFSRIPLWFGGAMIPHINPVIESSLYWPVPVGIVSQTFANATDTVILANPSGRHRLYTSLFVDLRSVPPTLGARYELALVQAPQGPVFGAGAVLFSTVVGTYIPTFLPLINSGTQQSYDNGLGGSTPVVMQGRANVYVGAGVVLAFRATGPNGGGTLSASYVELPENQPFGGFVGSV